MRRSFASKLGALLLEKAGSIVVDEVGLLSIMDSTTLLAPKWPRLCLVFLGLGQTLILPLVCLCTVSAYVHVELKVRSFGDGRGGLNQQTQHTKEAACRRHHTNNKRERSSKRRSRGYYLQLCHACVHSITVSNKKVGHVKRNVDG